MTRFPARWLIAALAFLGLAAGALPASAEMTVNPIVAELTGRNAFKKDLQVSNLSEAETIYVQVTVFEVTYPGTPEEKWVERKSPDESGLLAAPAQLVLAPGQTRVVRLVSVSQPTQTDRIYRVEIKPVVGEITATQSVIKVVVGYNVLVMARPDGATTEIVGSRSGGSLILRNAGNSAGFLFDGKACDPAGRTCSDLQAVRMYAGNELIIPLRPGQDRVEYSLEVSETVKKLKF